MVHGLHCKVNAFYGQIYYPVVFLRFLSFFFSSNFRALFFYFFIFLTFITNHNIVLDLEKKSHTSLNTTLLPLVAMFDFYLFCNGLLQSINKQTNELSTFSQMVQLFILLKATTFLHHFCPTLDDHESPLDS